MVSRNRVPKVLNNYFRSFSACSNSSSSISSS